jgi:hypothetical protein
MWGLERADTQIPRLILAALQESVTDADTGETLDLTKYFAGIGVHDYQELRFWAPPRLPYLAVVPRQMNDTLTASQKIDSLFEVHVLGYFYPLQSLDPNATPPAAPTLALVSPGTDPGLTGKYQYALSSFSDTGLSYVGEDAGVVRIASTNPSAKAVQVTMPKGTGLVLWRSEAGRDVLRIRAVYTKTDLDTSNVLTDKAADTKLGEEPAPIRFAPSSVMSTVKVILKASETLKNSGLATANAYLSFQDYREGLDTNLNIYKAGIKAVYPTRIQAFTRRAAVEVPG